MPSTDPTNLESFQELHRTEFLYGLSLIAKEKELAKSVDLLSTQLTELRSRETPFLEYASQFSNFRSENIKLRSLEDMSDLTILRMEIQGCERHLKKFTDELTEINSFIRYFERSHLC